MQCARIHKACCKSVCIALHHCNVTHIVQKKFQGIVCVYDKAKIHDTTWRKYGCQVLWNYAIPSIAEYIKGLWLCDTLWSCTEIQMSRDVKSCDDWEIKWCEIMWYSCDTLWSGDVWRTVWCRHSVITLSSLCHHSVIKWYSVMWHMMTWYHIMSRHMLSVYLPTCTFAYHTPRRHT